jgi:photosystem II stability/assembly factor-like uncharacterized protein
LVLLAASLVAIVTAWGGKAARKAKPAQNTPASLGPNSIAFWDTEHGLVGSGITWKKTTGAISATSGGGKSWQLVANQPVVGRSRVGSGGLAAYGYPQGISFSPQGYGLLWESRGNLYLTRDGGLHWQKLAVAEPEVDSGLSAVMLSRTQAFVLLSRGGGYRLLATKDGGQSWLVVQRWPAAH